MCVEMVLLVVSECEEEEENGGVVEGFERAICGGTYLSFVASACEC